MDDNINMDDNTNMDDNANMGDDNSSNDDTDGSSCSDPAIAKLQLKLSRIAMELDVEFYDSFCMDVIFDYTIIYMKSFIRGMARHKRKYNIQCPVLTGKRGIVEDNNRNNIVKGNNRKNIVEDNNRKNIVEDNNRKNIVEDKPVHEKLWPWQVKIDWEVVKRENIVFLDENDLEDTEDLSLLSFKRPSVPVIPGESMDTQSKNTDASCSKSGSSKPDSENSSNVGKRTNPAKKRKLCETIETPVKEMNDSLITEVENCDCKFDVKDFLDFLQSDPNAIPLRSVYELFQRDAQNKLAKKIRMFDFFKYNKIKES